MQYVRTEFVTTDVWAAAYLDLMDVRLLYTEVNAEKRGVWHFDNEGDRAFITAREFRTKGVAVVPIQDFRTCFRRMAGLAEQARRGIDDDKNNRDN